MDALRGHGYKCPYTSDGPFWALQDGNVFLKPFQCHVCRSDRLCHDEYAVYYSPRHHVDLRKCVRRTNWQHIVKSDNAEFLVAVNNHLMGIRKQDGCLEVNTSNRTHTWHKIYVDDLPSPLTYSVDLGLLADEPQHVHRLLCDSGLMDGGAAEMREAPSLSSVSFLHQRADRRKSICWIHTHNTFRTYVPVRKNYPCGRTQTTGAPAMLI